MSFLFQQFFGVSSGEKYVSNFNWEQLHGCTIKTGMGSFVAVRKILLANMQYAKESLK